MPDAGRARRATKLDYRSCKTSVAFNFGQPGTPRQRSSSFETIVGNKDPHLYHSSSASSSGSPVVSAAGSLIQRTPESSCNLEDGRLVSEDGASRLEILHAKYLVVASLMREVYALFDPESRADARTCTEHGTGSSSGQVSPPNNQVCDSANVQKRKQDDLNPEPPGDGEERKRQKRRLKQPVEGDPRGLHACPFNKFDPQSFAVNDATGQNYRTCWRPGFESIARLRYSWRNPATKGFADQGPIQTTSEEKTSSTNSMLSMLNSHVKHARFIYAYC